MHTLTFEISPIPVRRGPYSASRYVYSAIKANREDVICSDVDDFMVDRTDGILIFHQVVKRAVLEEMGLKNWAFGKFLHGRYLTKSGEFFDENAYALAFAEVDSDTLLKIAEKLCMECAGKSVLAKDRRAGKLFLIRLKNENA